MIDPPSLVEYTNQDTTVRFLIFEAPNESNLSHYIHIWKKFQIKHVVRTCDPTYPKSLVEKEGIQIHDLIFSDGSPPPPLIIEQWQDLVLNNPDSTIGIHCIAGLGRAPILVCIALIELGMDNIEAVGLVRARRPQSINAKQLQYLKQYHRHKKTTCSLL